MKNENSLAVRAAIGLGLALWKAPQANKAIGSAYNKVKDLINPPAKDDDKEQAAPSNNRSPPPISNGQDSQDKGYTTGGSYGINQSGYSTGGSYGEEYKGKSLRDILNG